MNEVYICGSHRYIINLRCMLLLTYLKVFLSVPQIQYVRYNKKNVSDGDLVVVKMSERMWKGSCLQGTEFVNVV